MFSECTETFPISIHQAFLNIIFFLSRILHRRKKIIRAQCRPVFLKLSKKYFNEILGGAGLYFDPQFYLNNRDRGKSTDYNVLLALLILEKLFSLWKTVKLWILVPLF